jgi:hypothetical protein
MPEWDSMTTRFVRSLGMDSSLFSPSGVSCQGGVQDCYIWQVYL